MLVNRRILELKQNKNNMSDQSTAIPTFAVATLGCKVNQADSEAIGEQMSAAGFAQRDFNDAADIYIVNTCTVTHMGDRSSRNMISQARRRHPDALLVVTGCYAELNPRAVAALPGVGLVVGNGAKGALVEAIEGKRREESAAKLQPARENLPPVAVKPARMLPVLPIDAQHIGSDIDLAASIGTDEEPLPDNVSRSALSIEATHATASVQTPLYSRTRVQMKVQDGCDNRCTYCIVPYVRGGSRSRSIASVVEHVQRKTRAGFKEVVLTGIHLGDYHPDGDERRDLGDLIAALLRETGMPRIRVSSLEPEDFRLEWLELWQNPRMCRHLHLPMQSGSDAILRRMARRYNSARYRSIVTTAKQLVPGMAISADIITGFPGESDDDFEQTYRLAAELQFAKAHVFRFSPRQGTPAARMKGQIRDEIKKTRSERLLALNEQDMLRFREKFVGETLDVLIEGARHGHWEGLTDNYLRVELEGLPGPAGRDWQNTLVKAQLIQAVDDGVVGAFVN
jgi:threonylcarbamoyladenosine tRNA methylthiotransferase MtaB